MKLLKILSCDQTQGWLLPLPASAPPARHSQALEQRCGRVTGIISLRETDGLGLKRNKTSLAENQKPVKQRVIFKKNIQVS